MIIVITLPDFFEGEALRCAELLRSGKVDLLHLRKPGASREDVAELLEEIPQELHRRIVLHDHFDLALVYGLYGVHLNSRNPEPPSGWKGSVSRSCHSLEELSEWKDCCNYVSLSPIFDSISKLGYNAAFSSEELENARRDGLIDCKVMALGGVTFARIPEVLAMGFGGAMILGDAWR